MQNNFMVFSELQKQLSPSPIKTWRLLKQLRDDGRMKDPDDYRMQDRKLYINVPRFIVELEHLGYANLKSNDFNNDAMKSDDIIKLAEELRLISDEITESRIQEEMISDDFSADENKQKFESQDLSQNSEQQNMKSSDINNHNNSSNVKSDDFSELVREIVETKNELINTLKGSASDKEKENKQLRDMLSDSFEQITSLTKQVTYLSNLLAAPKQDAEPMRRAKVKVTEVSDDDGEGEETQRNRDDDLAEHGENTAARASADAGDEISDFTDEITHAEDNAAEANTSHDTPGGKWNQGQRHEEMNSDEPVQLAS